MFYMYQVCLVLCSHVHSRMIFVLMTDVVLHLGIANCTDVLN